MRCAFKWLTDAVGSTIIGRWDVKWLTADVQRHDTTRERDDQHLWHFARPSLVKHVKSWTAASRLLRFLRRQLRVIFCTIPPDHFCLQFVTHMWKYSWTKRFFRCESKFALFRWRCLNMQSNQRRRLYTRRADHSEAWRLLSAANQAMAIFLHWRFVPGLTFTWRRVKYVIIKGDSRGPIIECWANYGDGKSAIFCLKFTLMPNG